MKIVTVIPARYESSRFPGKPLVEIEGKPLIYWTVRAANTLAAHKRGVTTVVATDDPRIMEAVHEHCPRTTCLMTGKARNGTERVADAMSKMTEFYGPEYLYDIDGVLNWQGDAPLIYPGVALMLIREMEKLIKSKTPFDVITPIVKCNFNHPLHQLYFRRADPGAVNVLTTTDKAALDFKRDRSLGQADEVSNVHALPVSRHMGMYLYKPSSLFEYPMWDMGNKEREQDLEQLRFIENKRIVRCVTVPEDMGISPEVNYPEDVAEVTKALRLRPWFGTV